MSRLSRGVAPVASLGEVLDHAYEDQDAEDDPGFLTARAKPMSAEMVGAELGPGL